MSGIRNYTSPVVRLRASEAEASDSVMSGLRKTANVVPIISFAFGFDINTKE